MFQLSGVHYNLYRNPDAEFPATGPVLAEAVRETSELGRTGPAFAPGIGLGTFRVLGGLLEGAGDLVSWL